MNQTIFCLLIGAFGAEALRMLTEEIINCIRCYFERKHRAAHREEWKAELFKEINRPMHEPRYVRKTNLPAVKEDKQ